MEINNALDMDLRNRMREELQTLKKYEQMFDEMTAEEKYELREWIANGNSVNSNPFLISIGPLSMHRPTRDMLSRSELLRCPRSLFQPAARLAGRCVMLFRLI